MTDDLACDATPWLIWKASRRGFYRPERQGYTDCIEWAGRFTREEAEAECRIEPWNIYAIPSREPPQTHPPQERTEQERGMAHEVLHKLNKFLDAPGARFIMETEEAHRSSGDEFLAAVKRWRALVSSPQGTVRDPGAGLPEDVEVEQLARNLECDWSERNVKAATFLRRLAKALAEAPTQAQIEAGARELFRIGNERIGERKWEDVGHYYMAESEAVLRAARRRTTKENASE